MSQRLSVHELSFKQSTDINGEDHLLVTKIVKNHGYFSGEFSNLITFFFNTLKHFVILI